MVIVNGHIQRIISSETKSLDQVKLTTQTPFTLDVQNLISGNISLATHDSNQLVINGTAVSYDKEALNKMGYTTTESDSSNTKVISIATYDNSPTQNPWGMTEQKDGVISHFGPYFAGNSNSINLNILVPAACNQFLIKSNNGGINLTTPGAQASFKATTLNGSINAENIYGTIICQTTNGSIGLKTIYGPTNVYSSNGTIRLENMFNQVNAQTSNGQIICNWKQLPQHPTHNVLQTSNGKISLSVPKKDVTIEASTSNGEINLNNKNYGTYLSQYFGSGKHSIKARTSNSKIDISAFDFI